MNELLINKSTFNEIKHLDEEGNEYWLARELQKVLEYSEWRKFNGVINKAISACNQSNISSLEHFVGIDKPIRGGNGNIQIVIDYKLSRYACYLIAQNGDSRKRVIALAQTYFAVQTRRQELMEKEYNDMSEDEKRLYQRKLTKKGNYSLNQIAKKSGVKNFDRFHNYGYQGLYNGETANDIAKRKGLRYREDILDNMGSEELIANLFRISQADAKLKRELVNTENNACQIHYNIGKEIRETIKKIGGTMPEELPKPAKSLKEITKKTS